MSLDPKQLRFDAQGLLPVVVQDAATGAVLMLAYADREAVEKTLGTGEAHFWSRSRRSPWRKGETSGNVLRVVEVLADCDGDALLVRAHPAGPACHRGTASCFEPNPAGLELGWLHRVLEGRRAASPEESYTARLLAAGAERIAQKVGEEAVEVVVAALSGTPAEARARLTAETADLLYHLLVLLVAQGVPITEVARELANRHARSPLPSPSLSSDVSPSRGGWEARAGAGRVDRPGSSEPAPGNTGGRPRPMRRGRSAGAGPAAQSPGSPAPVPGRSVPAGPGPRRGGGKRP